MDIQTLVSGSVIYVEAVGPLLLVFAAIACAGELVGLVKRAAGMFATKEDF